MRIARFRKGRRTVGLVAAGALVAALGLVGQSQADPSPPTLTEVQVGPEHKIGEPWIALNPGNGSEMVVAALSIGCLVDGHIYHSTNGSQWTQSTFAGGCERGIVDPSAAFDANGDVFVTTLWKQFPTSPRVDSVALMKSTDGGQSFAHHSYALEPGTMVTMPDGSQRALCTLSEFVWADWSKSTADSSPTSPFSGHLYVRANVDVDDGAGGCGGPPHVDAIIRSTDGGTTWTNGTALDNHDFGVWPGNITTGPDGTVFLATQKNTPSYGAPLCAGGTKGVGVVRSTDGGVSYQHSCIPTGGFADVYHPSVAVDPLDPSRVYVAFNIYGTGGPVYVVSSDDGGVTWGSPVEVYQGEDTFITSAHVSVSATGRVDLAWADNRNMHNQTTNMDVFYAYSHDHGQTFEPEIRVTPVTARYKDAGRNDYMSIASRGTEAYLAYAQDRAIPTSNWHEIFVTTVTHPN